MSDSGGSARRSRPAWLGRLSFAVLVAVLGYAGVTFSVAQAVARTNPELAHRLAPYSGRAAARLAASLSGIDATDATDADRRRAGRLARFAVRRDPTAVAAISTLGLDAQVRGDVAGARRLFAFAEKLSRRDLLTQLWLIEDSVARSDIEGSVRHYDIALRTSPQMAQVLFPVLTSASGEPAIRAALVRTLAGKPAWGESFVNYAATTTSDPRAIVQFLLGLQRAGVAVPDRARNEAINALAAGDRFDEAWAYYAAVRRHVDRLRSRDPRFLAGFGTPSVLDWVPVSDDRVNSSIQRGDRGGVLDFSAPAGIGGPVIRQMQMLTPGVYRITGHSAGIDQTENARPYWALRCQDGRELGRVIVPGSNQENGVFEGRFSVPAGCPVQTLMLVAQASDAVRGLSGQIDRVQLSPAH